MTMGQGASKENVKQFGEVFTPPFMTFQMALAPEVRDTLTDLRNATTDPCVGQGQFPATWLVLRMLYNIDRLDERTALHALYTLYGIDIQAESIDECKAHMLATFCDAWEFFTGREVPLELLEFAPAIIEHNFIVGDSLNDFPNCLERLGFHEEAERARAFEAEKQSGGKSKKKKPPEESRQLTLF